MKRIGVLALQGAFKEHINIIKSIGHEAIEIRKAEQLDDIDGIILPGGESTAMGKLLDDFKIKEVLVDKINNGLPTWGTCAGMILLATELDGDEDAHLKVMDIKVRRNAYGSQLDSFITKEAIEGVCEKEIPMVFIRAPYIVDNGESVELLHCVDSNIVAARQGNMLATSFHPELTDDTTFHEYFIDMTNKI
ncbi:pyridoxal 5'-phosphate synthase glutaminase subunit PdxT [Tepidibacter aestuarii]|uniref:pyridoxal 5'-phosphate synthase glutaminase subunit PdxT n=1 Tax=Tepidibacter aestuarii TaxID=2925782 RepID=UPI0020BDA600|nr:pyridoxal 5'-phosphate synthase glutaminase subunit PdxT [Tepidibacter aestuarii]CAH2215031.1 glutamine amidotransferase for pyridoxal phosphate synthesis; pyridoxal 5'-phosphate synthase complex, glutamine amidotransferase subunit PdxT [Tepidibacter aestuarii]